MVIKAKIPIQIFLFGKEKKAVQRVSANFSHKGLSCTIRFAVEEPVELSNREHWASAASAIELTVDDAGTNQLQESVDKPADGRLLKLLVTILNRCISAIRNFGLVPGLNTLYLDKKGDHEATLRGWNVEYSRDGKEWKSFRGEWTGEGLAEFLKGALLRPVSASVRPLQVTPDLDVAIWPEIAETIVENVSPQPEQELITNALEHLQLKNFRLAVIESIIGLEIVLNRFIREYLRTMKKVPEKRIKTLLGPNLTLSTKLTGILDLTLSEQELKRIDLTKVQKVVAWRNDIVHKQGRLPDIPEETITDRLQSVFHLVLFLAEKERQIRATPEIQEIVRNMFLKYPSFGFPDLRIHGSHQVWAKFLIVETGAGVPERSTYESVVAELSKLLKERDSHFDPDKHLTVSFLGLPNQLLGRWSGGKLQIMEEPSA